MYVNINNGLVAWDGATEGGASLRFAANLSKPQNSLRFATADQRQAGTSTDRLGKGIGEWGGGWGWVG
jgi:hypothetical protein